MIRYSLFITVYILISNLKMIGAISNSNSNDIFLRGLSIDSENNNKNENESNEIDRNQSYRSPSTHDYGIEVVKTSVRLVNASNTVMMNRLIIDGLRKNGRDRNGDKHNGNDSVARLQYDARVVNELCEHFTAINVPTVVSLGELLVRMREAAYQRVYGKHNLGHDGSSAGKKAISIGAKPAIAPFLFEGDILLNEHQATSILAHINTDERGATGRRATRSLSSDAEAIWRRAPIRFRFHDSLYFAITQILASIRFWEESTCLRFEHVHDPLAEDEDHIEFFKGQGCYSMIGRKGGRQGVSIGVGCERAGIIEHEIGHTLGLWHEQSRPDADKYVEVRAEFIIPTYVSDFQQRGSDEITSLNVPYDYGSVMHYGPKAFSADGFSTTLITRNPLFQSTIGQRERLSFYDVQIINKAYCANKCESRSAVNALDDAFLTRQPACRNGGYPHPANCSRCICPSGYGGDECTTNQPPKNAQCGGVIYVGLNEWRSIRSPGYDADGYEEDQRCAWVVRAPRHTRVLAEFADEFAFLCSSICQDFVELKLALDQRATGPSEPAITPVCGTRTVGLLGRIRSLSIEVQMCTEESAHCSLEGLSNDPGRTNLLFCCDFRPEEQFVSQTNQMAIIFRSQASQDRGFHLRVRAKRAQDVLTETLRRTTSSTQTPSTTLAGSNVWAAWGEWSACSRSCGACGIRSRVRACLTAKCENHSQEFGACNFETCPVQSDCERLLFLNRVCQRSRDFAANTASSAATAADITINSSVCTDVLARVADCQQPSCCPPFYAQNGRCVSRDQAQNGVSIGGFIGILRRNRV